MNRAASYFRGLEFDIVTDRGDEDHETRYDTFARIGANWYLVCSCSLWTSGPRWEAEFSQAIAQLPALPNEVRRGTFASGPATEAEKQADAATLKRCAICGEYQSGGAIGAAGIHWGNLCQPCKDNEDKAALAQCRVHGELYRYLAQRFAQPVALVAALLLVFGSTTAEARGRHKKTDCGAGLLKRWPAGPYKAHRVQWRLGK
jgi:hypothetical protein